MDLVYKLVQYAGRPVLKLSSEKKSLAGEKQIFRFTDETGRLKKDVIGLRDDAIPESESLLKRAMKGGAIVSPSPTLPQIQKTFLDEFDRLDAAYKSITKAGRKFPVVLSPRLKSLQLQTTRRIKKRELGR